MSAEEVRRNVELSQQVLKAIEELQISQADENGLLVENQRILRMMDGLHPETRKRYLPILEEIYKQKSNARYLADRDEIERGYQATNLEQRPVDPSIAAPLGAFDRERRARSQAQDRRSDPARYASITELPSQYLSEEDKRSFFDRRPLRTAAQGKYNPVTGKFDRFDGGKKTKMKKSKMKKSKRKSKTLYK